MKHIANCFTTLFIVTFLISCGSKEEKHTNEAEPATPEALQDNNSYEITKSRGDNLVEELYQGLVEKDSALKEIEEDLEAFASKPNEMGNILTKYDRKSASYYVYSQQMAAHIKDSVLEKKIQALISISSKRYANKTAELTGLLKQISENGSTIQDHHTALKIVLTLPLIEKYQNDYLPKADTFKNAVKQQEKIIQKIDKATPTY